MGQQQNRVQVSMRAQRNLTRSHGNQLDLNYLASQHFVEQDSKRPPIHGLPIGLISDYLEQHEQRGYAPPSTSWHNANCFQAALRVKTTRVFTKTPGWWGTALSNRTRDRRRVQ